MAFHWAYWPNGRKQQDRAWMRKELLLVHIRKLLICHVRTKCMIWLQTHLFFVTRIVRSYLQHYGYEDTLSAFDMACQSTVPPIYIAQENGFDEQDIVYALNQRKTLRQVWIISPKIPSVLYEGTGELSLDFFFFFLINLCIIVRNVSLSQCFRLLMKKRIKIMKYDDILL